MESDWRVSDGLCFAVDRLIGRFDERTGNNQEPDSSNEDESAKVMKDESIRIGY